MTLELSEDQIKWVNALAAATGQPGLAVPEEGDVDHYADGKGYAGYTKEDAPAGLQDENMPDAAGWEAVGKELESEARQLLADFDKNRSEIADKTRERKDLSAELSKKQVTYDDLLIQRNKKLDERPKKQGNAKNFKKWERERKAIQNQLSPALSEINNLRRKIKKIEQGVTATCLKVIDAPGNNPERKKIDTALVELSQLDEKIALARKSEDRQEEASTLMAEKCALLNEMTRDIGEWTNRRMEQGLPPSREAMAMGDIVQREHQKLIEYYVGQDGSPMPPLADQENMTDAEIEAAQNTWAALVNNTGAIQILTTMPTEDKVVRNIKFADPKPVGVDDQKAQLEEFRIEMLAAMARLMGSPSGRELLAAIEQQSTKNNTDLRLFPGSGASCMMIDREMASLDYSVTPPRSGGGSSAVVYYDKNSADTSKSYAMDDGNFLYGPTYIVLGHELVHALHDMEGTNRNKEAIHPIDRHDWDNAEEYWTIRKGDLSEQTLRDENGLSALRFAHSNTAKNDNPNAKTIEMLDAAKHLDDLRNGTDDKQPADVEAVLRDERKFTGGQVEAMTDVIKLDLYNDAEAVGPLPDGWDPARLTVGKIKSIVRDKLPYRLKTLGWTVYKLEYDGIMPQVFGFPQTIKCITISGIHSPRSAAGRLFKRLGGREVIAEFEDFNRVMNAKLGTWNSVDWSENLKTLVAAERTINDMINDEPHIRNQTDPERIVTVNDTLKEKIRRIKLIGPAVS